MNYVGRILGWNNNQAPATPPSPKDAQNKPLDHSQSKSQPQLGSNQNITYESLTAESANGKETTEYKEEKEKEEAKKSLWNLVKGFIGVDPTQTCSLPIWLFEDMSYLQRLCEMTEFSTFFDQANKSENQFERMLFVALFCITAFHGTERYDKPFNPVIGETFEYVRETGERFLAEQVSHKPPLSVCSLENDNFILRQTGVLNVRFLGNSLDVDSTSCKCFVTLKRTGEVFTWRTPRATVHNAIVGKVWVDHHGLMPIKNQATSDKCDIKWKKCGWFGANRYEVEGDVVDSQGNPKISIFGKWNGTLSAKWLFDGLHPKGTTVDLWTKDPTQVGPHNVTPFAKELNKMTAEYEKLLPPTDARFRPDRRYLERRESAKASTSKLQVEDKQRTQEAARRNKNEPWVPRWFYSVPDEYYEGTMWLNNDEYWKERELKEKLLQEDPEAAKKLLVREGVDGLACDFKSYPYEL